MEHEDKTRRMGFAGRVFGCLGAHHVLVVIVFSFLHVAAACIPVRDSGRADQISYLP
jgi:hypothetical protein